MKMRKFFIFVKKNLKINMLKMKDIIKLGTIVITYCISSNKRPGRLSNFETVKCLLEDGTNNRETLISKLGK